MREAILNKEKNILEKNIKEREEKKKKDDGLRKAYPVVGGIIGWEKMR